MISRILIGLVFLIAIAIGNPASAAVDTLINSTQTLDQERQDAVQLVNGTLVFVYEDESVTNGQIFLRRFDSNLFSIAGEQRVNVATNGERREPVIAALTGGGFVVAYNAGNLDADNSAVAFRRYDASANPLDVTDVVANTITAAAQFRPRIAPLTNGGFVIAWLGQSGGVGQDIFYRRFSAAGIAADANDVRANALGNDPVTTGDQGNHNIATLRAGSFVIVYEDRSTDDVFGVRIAVNGTAVDAPGESAGNKQFRINTVLPFEQTSPSVAGLTNGGFVVTYNSETNGTSASRCVLGRIFGSNGVGGTAFQVGAHTNRWQDSRVAGLANGDFAVTWQAHREGVDAGTNTWSVFAQVFGSAGVPWSAPAMVNTFNVGNQDSPSLASVGNGGYVVAWQSFAQDADRYGVFAQAFLPVAALPGVLSIVRFPVSQTVSVNFTGQGGRQHLLQRSANLTAWTSILTTNPASGTFQYSEPHSSSPRFYRVRSQ